MCYLCENNQTSWEYFHSGIGLLPLTCLDTPLFKKENNVQPMAEVPPVATVKKLKSMRDKNDPRLP